MNTLLQTEAKQVGAALIDLSDRLSSKMQSWSDMDARPNGLDVTECVGFTTREDGDSPITMLVDLMIPKSADEGELRLWSITNQKDVDANEIFNNIQLSFLVDKDTAHAVANKAGSVVRADMKNVLTHGSTRLKRVIVSDNSGRTDEGDFLGLRYDVEINEQEPIDQEAEIVDSLHQVLEKLSHTDL